MKLRDMEIFLKVVSEGSITGAADLLDLPKSTISRHLKALEDSLNTRLVDRTTRRLALTDAGTEFHRRCQVILGYIEETRGLLSSGSETPKGKLTICAPTIIYSVLISKYLPAFIAAYPEIQLKLLSYESILPNDFERIDIVIHIGPPPDIARVGRPITRIRANYYATSSYLEANGRPETLADLNHHRYIEILRTDKHLGSWKDIDIKTQNVNPPIQVDTVSISAALCREGVGISFLPEMLVKDAKLINVFNSEYQKTVPIFALYASRKFVPAKIHAFIDYFKNALVSDKHSV